MGISRESPLGFDLIYNGSSLQIDNFILPYMIPRLRFVFHASKSDPETMKRFKDINIISRHNDDQVDMDEDNYDEAGGNDEIHDDGDDQPSAAIIIVATSMPQKSTSKRLRRSYLS